MPIFGKLLWTGSRVAAANVWQSCPGLADSVWENYPQLVGIFGYFRTHRLSALILFYSTAGNVIERGSPYVVYSRPCGRLKSVSKSFRAEPGTACTYAQKNLGICRTSLCRCTYNMPLVFVHLIFSVVRVWILIFNPLAANIGNLLNQPQFHSKNKRIPRRLTLAVNGWSNTLSFCFSYCSSVNLPRPEQLVGKSINRKTRCWKIFQSFSALYRLPTVSAWRHSEVGTETRKKSLWAPG